MHSESGKCRCLGKEVDGAGVGDDDVLAADRVEVVVGYERACAEGGAVDVSAAEGGAVQIGDPALLDGCARREEAVAQVSEVDGHVDQGDLEPIAGGEAGREVVRGAGSEAGQCGDPLRGCVGVARGFGAGDDMYAGWRSSASEWKTCSECRLHRSILP
jgi:hypothetical protein